MKFEEYTESMNPVYADISVEEVIEKHGGTSWGEIKEDGYRCQIHVNDSFVKMFTKAGKEYACECYPEIVQALRDLNLEKTVLDAEMKGESIGYKGFIPMRKRFRKKVPKKIGDYQKLIKEFPLRLVVFDTLMFEGKELLGAELICRRKYTENMFGKKVTPSELYKITSEEQFNKLFQEKVKKERNEGFVLKNPCSEYIGNPKELYQKDENYNWIKIKNFETLDLVIVGLMKSEAEYTKNLKFSSALCAMKNNETKLYEIIGSVSLVRKNPTTDNSFSIDLERMIRKHSDAKPSNVCMPEKLEKKYNGIMYVKPEESQVIAVKAMNIEFDGNNYTFRIAHISDIREDKNVSQTTTSKEVEEVYKVQKGKEDKR